jgi:hypothetical protein
MHADDDDRLSQPAAKPATLKKVFIAIVLLGIVGAGVWYYWQQKPAAPELPPIEVAEPVPVVDEPPPEVDLPYPILDVPVDEEEQETGPDYGLPDTLTALENADPLLNEQVGLLFPGERVWDSSAASELVSKFVGFIYALAEGDIDYRMLPLQSPKERFSVSNNGDEIYLKVESYQRYSQYAEAFAELDVERAIAVYKFFWPMLDQLFQQYGEPEKTLHGELLESLDLLLAAPELDKPPRLIRPTVYYQFADPRLEALPGAQKQLVRMGPENTRLIKNKLRSLLDALNAITETRTAREKE